MKSPLSIFMYCPTPSGKYDQGTSDQLGPNGCCDQAINSIQSAVGAMVDGLKQAKNYTYKTQVRTRIGRELEIIISCCCPMLRFPRD